MEEWRLRHILRLSPHGGEVAQHKLLAPCQAACHTGGRGSFFFLISIISTGIGHR